MIIPINVVKLFDKIQHPFEIKTFRSQGIKENFLTSRKGIYKKSTVLYLKVEN